MPAAHNGSQKNIKQVLRELQLAYALGIHRRRDRRAEAEREELREKRKG